jgi:hypothetical protein
MSFGRMLWVFSASPDLPDGAKSDFEGSNCILAPSDYAARLVPDSKGKTAILPARPGLQNASRHLADH